MPVPKWYQRARTTRYCTSYHGSVVGGLYCPTTSYCVVAVRTHVPVRTSGTYHLYAPCYTMAIAMVNVYVLLSHTGSYGPYSFLRYCTSGTYHHGTSGTILWDLPMVPWYYTCTIISGMAIPKLYYVHVYLLLVYHGTRVQYVHVYVHVYSGF
jgi:hypothetical protein